MELYVHLTNVAPSKAADLIVKMNPILKAWGTKKVRYGVSQGELGWNVDFDNDKMIGESSPFIWIAGYESERMTSEEGAYIGPKMAKQVFVMLLSRVTGLPVYA